MKSINEQLIKDLQELPEKIAKTEKEIFILSQSLSVIKIEMEAVEGEIFTQVCEEKIENTAKPYFTNDVMRKAQSAIRLRRHEGFVELGEKLNERKEEMTEKAIQLNKFKNEFSATKYIIKLLRPEED